MYFSAKAFHKAFNDSSSVRCWSAPAVNAALNRDRYGRPPEKISLSQSRRVMKEVKSALLSRDSRQMSRLCVFKWTRPWDVVDKLKNFSVPVGDFGVGVEVEMGFNSQQSAAFIADKVKNWKYITLDVEGGSHPIELTFAPFLYSKFGSKSQPVRYIKLLQAHRDRVVRHREGSCVGTHINVSKGGVSNISEYFHWNNRGTEVNDILDTLFSSEKSKYFGRSSPYGYMYSQSKYVEMKMFNSTTDVNQFKRYVNTAVALADYIFSAGATVQPNIDAVRAALELGYSKRV